MKVNNRELEYPCNELFPKRWSPRAFSGESITNEELMTLFEAARWAPSAYNNQSWRFIYAKRDTEDWKKFFNLLAEPNRVWCKNAAVLIVTISKKIFDHNGKPSITHSFDTGSAWGSLALQGTLSGLFVHGMQGFDYLKAKNELNIPEDYSVEMMIAIGKPGTKENLPENLQAIELPSDRKKMSEIIMEGCFK